MDYINYLDDIEFLKNIALHYFPQKLYDNNDNISVEQKKFRYIEMTKNLIANKTILLCYDGIQEDPLDILYYMWNDHQLNIIFSKQEVNKEMSQIASDVVETFLDELKKRRYGSSRENY